jgi:hypothetical protein
MHCCDAIAASGAAGNGIKAMGKSICVPVHNQRSAIEKRRGQIWAGRSTTPPLCSIIDKIYADSIAAL